MHALAEKNDATIKAIWCAASSKARLKRILERDRPRDRDRTEEEKKALAKKKGMPKIPFKHTVHRIEHPDIEALVEFLGV
jgi:cytidylate kinase